MMYPALLVKETYPFNPTYLIPEAQELVGKILEALPGVKFGTGHGLIYVYFDGDAYCRGGFSTQIPDDEHNLAYFIESPFIENKVSRPNSSGYYQKRFRTIDGAVKAAKKFFRPLTAGQTVKHRANHLAHYVRKEHTDLQDQSTKIILRDGTGVSRIGYQIMTELEHHLDNMHDSDIKDKIAEFVDLQAEMCGLCGEREFVYMLRHGSGYSTQKVTVDVGTYHDPKYPEDESFVSVDTLDSALADKIAVLGVLEDDQYLEDVGYKVTDGAYYVSLL